MAGHVKLSPVRPIQDVIPAAPVPSLANPIGWASRSHTGLAQGVSVKSIVGADGSTPGIIWVGFNKQPPMPMRIQDTYSFPGGFTSVEFYNNTATAWTVTALVYDGNLIP